MAFYNKKCTDPCTETGYDVNIVNIEKTINDKIRFPQKEIELLEFMNTPIQEFEIMSTFNHYKDKGKKSPGYDGITMTYLKRIKTSMIPILRRLFNNIWDSGSMTKSIKTR